MVLLGEAAFRNRLCAATSARRDASLRRYGSSMRPRSRCCAAHTRENHRALVLDGIDPGMADEPPRERSTRRRAGSTSPHPRKAAAAESLQVFGRAAQSGLCTSPTRLTGRSMELDEDRRRHLGDGIEVMAANGLRRRMPWCCAPAQRRSSARPYARRTRPATSKPALLRESSAERFVSAILEAGLQRAHPCPGGGGEAITQTRARR